MCVGNGGEGGEGRGRGGEGMGPGMGRVEGEGMGEGMGRVRVGGWCGCERAGERDVGEGSEGQVWGLGEKRHGP